MLLDQVNFNFVIELDENTKVNIREDLEKIVGMVVEGFRVEGAIDGMEVEGLMIEPTRCL